MQLIHSVLLYEMIYSVDLRIFLVLESVSDKSCYIGDHSFAKNQYLD